MSQIMNNKRLLVQWMRREGISNQGAPANWTPALVEQVLSEIGQTYDDLAVPMFAQSRYPYVNKQKWGTLTRNIPEGHSSTILRWMSARFGSASGNGAVELKDVPSKSGARKAGANVYLIFGYQKSPRATSMPAQYMIVDGDGRLVSPEFVRTMDNANLNIAAYSLGYSSIAHDTAMRKLA